jgi:DNA-directed RNA polymerase specialized sigma24 family protein
MIDHTAELDRFRGAFVALVAGRSANAPAVLDLVCRNPWCTCEMRIAAERTLDECGAPRGWLDDVSQEMVVLLSRDLGGAPSLHYDCGRPADSFAAWFRGVLHLLALQAVRKHWIAEHPHCELREDDCGMDPTIAVDLSVDLAGFIEPQSERVRAIVELLLQGYSRGEAGKIVGVSAATVSRSLEGLADALRIWLDAGEVIHRRQRKSRRPNARSKIVASGTKPADPRGGTGEERTRRDARISKR